jgi:hypothetical protein
VFAYRQYGCWCHSVGRSAMHCRIVS